MDVVQSVSDEVYQKSVNGYRSMGAHFRHILDHYDCFFTGLSEGVIDYTSRQRDPLTETDRMVAYGRFQSVCIQINEIDPASIHRLVRLSGPNDMLEMVSTVGRELAFLSSHTIHHFATINRISDQLGVSLNIEFGMAKSTISYHKQQY